MACNNVFETDDINILEERVQNHIGRIIFNSYMKAMNLVVVDSSRNETIHEIERIEKLLDVDNQQIEDNGAFRKVLVTRIQKVFINKKSKGHAMDQLEEEIKEPLAEILTIIFSNGNSVLYYG
eukprot:803044_1